MNLKSNKLKQKLKLKLNQLSPLTPVTIILIIAFAIISISRHTSNNLRLQQAPTDSTYLFTASSDQLTINISNKDNNYPKVELKTSENSSINFTLSHLNQETVSKPQKDGNKITYKDILPYTDLTYQTTSNGIKEELILKAPPPAGSNP